jgi:predicted dehydrogenase
LDASESAPTVVMLSVAIVGAGAIGRIRAKSITESGRGSVSWIADIDVRRAQELAASSQAHPTTNWREIISDPRVDCVVVSTPTKFHTEIATECLRAGKHVLCEKPLARNAREARTVVEAAHRAGRVLKTGFNYRQMAHIRKAQELLEAGAIGNPFFFRCRYGHGGRPNYQEHWCTDAELSGGGVLQEQGIHIVDLVRVLLGEPAKVIANIQRYFWPFSQAEDNCFCLFETAGHQVAELHVSWTQWKNILEIEIFGAEGYLRLEGRDGHYGPQRLTLGKRQPTHSKPVEERFTFDEAENSWDREWREFASTVTNGSDRSNAAVQGLLTQEVVDAAYRSAREQAWVSMTEFRKGTDDHH